MQVGVGENSAILVRELTNCETGLFKNCLRGGIRRHSNIILNIPVDIEDKHTNHRQNND